MIRIISRWVWLRRPVIGELITGRPHHTAQRPAEGRIYRIFREGSECKSNSGSSGSHS